MRDVKRLGEFTLDNIIRVITVFNKRKADLKEYRWYKILIRYASVGRLKLMAWSIVRAVLIIGISFIILYPLLMKISMFFMDQKDLYDRTVKWIPKNLTLENVKIALEYMNYWHTFMNTVKVVLFTTVLQTISCTLVGYGFARFRFPGRSLLFSLVIFTLLVPPQTIMVPLYMNFRILRLLDTYWPYILTSATCMGIRNGLYIYMIRQFFRQMPKEIEEAAMVDGAGVFKTFYSVMLPSATPVLVTTVLFSIVWQWNDTFYANLFWVKNQVLSSALSALTDNYQQFLRITEGIHEFSPVYRSLLDNVGMLLVIFPLLILYAFAQKYFIESIERSGIVG